MAVQVAKGIVQLKAATAARRLGFRPQALVLWWCREPPAGCTGGIGFGAGAGGEASVAWVADDALNSGAPSQLGADTALLLYEDPSDPDSTARGHVHFDDHGFSFDFDREAKHEWLVHYFAVGGSGVPGAAVRCLTLDDTGRRSITGLEFEPGIVLATAGAGSMEGVARQDGLAVAFGAATGPTRQVAAGFVGHVDSDRSIVRGAHYADSLAVLPAVDGFGGIEAVARLVSLDRDGFTVETTHAVPDLPLALLAIGGDHYSVGLGDAASPRTAVGLEPAGALLFGTGLAAMPRARDIGRMCLGGFSDAENSGCVSWAVRARGAWPLAPRSRSSADGPFEVIDTTSDELHARASLSAVGSRGFSLAWPVSDQYRRDFGYVAVGSRPRKRMLRGRLRLFGRRSPLRE
jgi:hypothetical protein